MTIDFAALRRRFPVLERKTYLNSCSYCALADTVRDAFNRVGAREWDDLRTRFRPELRRAAE